MEIRELLKDYRDNLLEPILILSEILKIDKAYIYAFPERKVTEEEIEKFNLAMDRLKLGEPIQYILGYKEFMALDFKVEKGVLIPRNDTEVLVEFLIDEIGSKELSVLELGYGSGAIILSLANYCKESHFTGVDISEIAYKVANENKESFGLKNVKLLKGDLFQPVDEKFNIIVSNPPYIEREEMESLDSKVKDFEPTLALDGGVDGLDFYREITKESGKYLFKDGLLAFEIGYNQKREVMEILSNEGFYNIGYLKDLAGLDRVVYGYKGAD